MCAINWEKILSTSGPGAVTRKLKIHMGPVYQGIASLVKKLSPPLSLLEREAANHRSTTLSCLTHKHLSPCLRRILVWGSQLQCLVEAEVWWKCKKNPKNPQAVPSQTWQNVSSFSCWCPGKQSKMVLHTISRHLKCIYNNLYTSNVQWPQYTRFYLIMSRMPTFWTSQIK